MYIFNHWKNWRFHCMLTAPISIVLSHYFESVFFGNTFHNWENEKQFSNIILKATSTEVHSCSWTMRLWTLNWLMYRRYVLLSPWEFEAYSDKNFRLPQALLVAWRKKPQDWRSNKSELYWKHLKNSTTCFWFFQRLCTFKGRTQRVYATVSIYVQLCTPSQLHIKSVSLPSFRPLIFFVVIG